MTANQISFYKAKNEKEHYERMDKENRRHNVMTEALNQSDLDIKDWYNKATIAKDYANIDMLSSHYAQSDAAAVVNANSNWRNAQLKTEEVQLALSNAYGGNINDVTWDNERQSFLVNPRTSNTIDYLNKEAQRNKTEAETAQIKKETALTTYSLITQGLGNVGRLLGPIGNVVTKVLSN